MSVGKGRGQQAVGSSNISGTSGSGSQSSVYSSGISVDREFDSTLGHPGEDLGWSSNQLHVGGGSGNGMEAGAGAEEDSNDGDDSSGSSATTIVQPPCGV